MLTQRCLARSRGLPLPRHPLRLGDLSWSHLGADVGGVGHTLTVNDSAGTGNLTVDGSAMTANLNILGGSGTDHLIGGSGNDSITGGAGADVLTGGGGIVMAKASWIVDRRWRRLFRITPIFRPLR